MHGGYPGPNLKKFLERSRRLERIVLSLDNRWYTFIPFRFFPISLCYFPLARKPALMKVAIADRRVTRRYTFEAPLRVRIWKSDIPAQRAESENLSEKGIFFTTDSLLRVGAMVEILLEMPEEITDEPTIEWLCTGHVVRVEPLNSSRGKLGVGVQFDCYQILRSKTA
jgi:PilZ domain